ncbi:hypothetical protein GCM10025787_54360 [Saccharopolyspora rosea]
MTSLRNAAPRFVRTGQLVAVHQHDLPVELGEDPRGEQPRHPPAEHDSASVRTTFHLLTHLDSGPMWTERDRPLPVDQRPAVGGKESGAHFGESTLRARYCVNSAQSAPIVGADAPVVA